MEGLLGWWESRARDELDLVCDALVAVGLGAQAELLYGVAQLLPPTAIGALEDRDEHSVSSFGERHPNVSREQYAALADLEKRLWYNDPSGPDVHDLLMAHAENGLAGTSG